jgi:hypothetical protein
MARVLSAVASSSFLLLAVACSSATAAPDLKSDKNAVNTPRFGNAAGNAAPDSAGCQKDPSYYDVPGDGCDNDGDGTVDNPPSCDGTALESPEDFAHTMGICDKASERGYGLVSATFTRGYQVDGDPDPHQHNVLTQFGSVIRPREGSRLGILSTGYAQEFDGNEGDAFTPGTDWETDGAAPPGFPKAAGDCPQRQDVHNVVAVKLQLKAPPNATGLKFDFDFHSSEWPQWVCSEFNDGFVAYLTAKGFHDGTPDNISFDAKNNPVSVNNGFFDRCTPNTTTGCSGDNTGTSACAGGPDELAGTGFGRTETACGAETATQGGATGWLSSQAPVTPGETFTLELMIWDTGDGKLDSTVLLDNFQWIGGAVTTQTERVTGVK